MMARVSDRDPVFRADLIRQIPVERLNLSVVFWPVAGPGCFALMNNSSSGM